MKNKLGVSLCTFCTSTTALFLTDIFMVTNWTKDFKVTSLYGIALASVVVAFIVFLFDRK